MTLGIFWHYLLESSLILATLCAVYMLCLRTLRQHNTKRIALLSIAALSLLLPLISFSQEINVAQ